MLDDENTFFVSDSIKDKIGLSEEEKDNDYSSSLNEELQIEFIFKDDFLFLTLNEICLDKNIFISFNADIFDVKKIFKKEVEEINILIDNENLYKLNIEKISNFKLEKNNSNYKICFFTDIAN